MAKGDHLEVKRVGYYHHGVDLGDGQVIHYRGSPFAKRNAKVRIDPMDLFVRGSRVRVLKHDNPDEPDVIIGRARSRLEEKSYNLVFRNCEHFANWCVEGAAFSPQVQHATDVGGAVAAGQAVRFVAGRLVFVFGAPVVVGGLVGYATYKVLQARRKKKPRSV